jgi:hypothetical protein
MTNPITPPPELVQQWEKQFLERPTINGCFIQSYIATKAAQWGANQKLEACCKWLEQLEPARDYLAAQLRAANPPGLKEQALGALGRFNTNAHTRADEMDQDFDLIRRALEALPND